MIITQDEFDELYGEEIVQDEFLHMRRSYAVWRRVFRHTDGNVYAFEFWSHEMEGQVLPHGDEKTDLVRVEPVEVTVTRYMEVPCDTSS